MSSNVGQKAPPKPSAASKPITLPSRAEQRYLAAFKLGAVIVFTGSRITIAATNDPGEATMAARRTWPKDAPPVLTAALWASNLRDAQQVANLTMASDLRGARRDGSGRMSIDAAVATAAIHSAAGRLKIPIVENDVVLSRAKLAAGALSGALDAAQNDGTLKLFNKRYRKRRQAAQAEGRAFVSYGTARAKLESELARAAAGDIGGINFDRVFAATADEPAIK
jgi:hypothetical protein